MLIHLLSVRNLLSKQIENMWYEKNEWRKNVKIEFGKSFLHWLTLVMACNQCRKSHITFDVVVVTLYKSHLQLFLCNQIEKCSKLFKNFHINTRSLKKHILEFLYWISDFKIIDLVNHIENHFLNLFSSSHLFATSCSKDLIPFS